MTPSRQAGALNTAARRDGGWEGSNTDVEGFLAPLTDRKLAARAADPRRGRPRRGGRRCPVARKKRGWCTARTRRQRRGAELADFRRHRGIVAAGRAAAGICWSTPRRSASPRATTRSPPIRRSRRPLVYDLVYNPPPTRLLRDARLPGCRRSAASRCSSRRRSAVRVVDRRASRHHAARRESAAAAIGGRPAGDEADINLRRVRRAGRRGTFVPVYKEIVADLLTPVSAFLKIAEHSDYAFLLESVEGGEHVGRYSFLGKDPFLVLRAAAGGRSIERAGVTTEPTSRSSMTLRGLMAEFRAPFVPELPRFTGGAVGYLGYDARSGSSRCSRRRLARTPADGADEAGFMLFDTVLAFDHVKHRILIIANARITPTRTWSRSTSSPARRSSSSSASSTRPVAAATTPTTAPPDVRTSRAERFEDRRARGQGAHRRRRHLPGGAVAALRGRGRRRPVHGLPRAAPRQPVALHVFLRMGGVSIVGSSPEMLVRVEGRTSRRTPIAGTRPRGAHRRGGPAARRGAERNEKERAEHVMLVDLGRNDVGRVCEYGTVRVPQFMTLERYSHVMHLVSTSRAGCRRTRDRLDALVACFPAGTVSGAPKIRAMEIIDGLEPTRRGSTPARSATSTSPATWTSASPSARSRCATAAHVQAGAGIVADSNPAARIRGDARQGARAAARARAGAGGLAVAMVLLVIDNYDSFTYNLVQYLGELGAEVSVRRNDEITLDEIARWPRRDRDLAGPGPPEEAGISIDVIRRFGARADARRLPRPSGDRRGVRRQRRARAAR